MSNFPDTEKPRFVYWKANSRALAPMLMLDAAGIEYVWDDATANTWPKPKADLPFGQLPVLYHNDMCIAQSATITRYCARLAKLTSMDEKENVVSDMLQEHCNDIFNEFGRAKYCPDVPELKEKLMIYKLILYVRFSVFSNFFHRIIIWISSASIDRCFSRLAIVALCGFGFIR